MAKTSKPTSVNEDDYQAQDDARTLTRAQEVAADKPRHKKAVKHLAKQAKSAGDAHAAAKQQLKGAAMHQKVKSGLKKAFPSY